MASIVKIAAYRSFLEQGRKQSASFRTHKRAVRRLRFSFFVTLD
jgi:hypothetical protein